MSLVSFQREVLRQTVHVALGMLCILVLFLSSMFVFRAFILTLLITGAIVSLLVERRVLRSLDGLLTRVERQGEHVPGEAAFLFVAGVGLTSFLFFSPLPVLVGIVAYTFQDSFSAIFGLRFGKTKILGPKSLEGSFAGFVGCLIPLAIILPLPLALAVAFVATLVELLPINDAFGVPLASALTIAFFG